MIKVENIKKAYRGVEALKGVNLRVGKGEVLLILGPNGAGKTTLVRIILGLLFQDEGKISINKNIRIGYMKEDDFGKESWKVARLLRYICELNGIKKDILTNRVKEVVKNVELNKKTNKKINQLSKGMKQRVKWAQAALVNPDLYILDEPTSGLDPIGKYNIRKWMKEEKEKGKTFIISSHLLDEMEKIGDRFMILVNGKKKIEDEINKLTEKDLENYFIEIVKGDSNENNF